LLAPTLARAGESRELHKLLEHWPAELRGEGGFRLFYHTEEDVDSQSDGENKTEFGLLEYDIDVKVPIWVGDGDQLVFWLDFDNLDVDTKAKLPRPDVDFPDSLLDLGFNFTWKVFMDENRTAGVHLRLGTAGDELFGDDTGTISATGFLQIPDWMIEENSWIFYLNYANRRTGNDLSAWNTSGDLDEIPMPGFAYQLTVHESNWVQLGLPYSAAHAEPLEWFTIDFRYLFPRSAHARLTYEASEKLEFYGALDWDGRVFFRSDRKHGRHRMVMVEKKAYIGALYRWKKNLWLTLELGRSFDRFIYEDEDYDDRKQNWFEIDSSKYLSFEIKFRF
jgi:hypothetical protein